MPSAGASAAALTTRPFAGALARMILPRALIFWLVLQVLALLAPAIAGGLPDLGPSVAPSAAAPALSMGMLLANASAVAALVALDMRATRQQLLLANLGIGLRTILALAFGATALLELLRFAVRSVASAIQ